MNKYISMGVGMCAQESWYLIDMDSQLSEQARTISMVKVCTLLKMSGTLCIIAICSSHLHYSLSPSVLGWLGINEFVKKHPSCRPDLVLEQEHGNYRSCHGTPWHAFADPVAFEEERECGKGGKCGAGKKGAQDHGGLSRPRSRHWAEENFMIFLYFPMRLRLRSKTVVGGRD